MRALKLAEKVGTAQPRTHLRHSSEWSAGTLLALRPTFAGGDWLGIEHSILGDDWIEAALSPPAKSFGVLGTWRPKVESRLWSNAMADCVDRLGRMVDGWAGPGSVAPTTEILEEVQEFTPILPLRTRIPEIEVEPGDGEVKLAWRASSQPRSLAVAFSGDGVARVLQANLDEPVEHSLVEIQIYKAEASDIALVLSALENCDLLEVE
jgi:hypothetical protein